MLIKPNTYVHVHVHWATGLYEWLLRVREGCICRCTCIYRVAVESKEVCRCIYRVAVECVDVYIEWQLSV